MKCRTSLPIGKRSRFRAYRCPECRTYVETVEVLPLLLTTPTPEELRKLLMGMEEARNQRFRFIQMGKKRAAATASAELMQ